MLASFSFQVVCYFCILIFVFLVCSVTLLFSPSSLLPIAFSQSVSSLQVSSSWVTVSLWGFLSTGAREGFERHGFKRAAWVRELYGGVLGMAEQSRAEKLLLSMET